MHSSDRINMVLDYLEQNLDKPLEEEALAAIAGCPFGQFQRIFSFFTGISLQEYLRRRRLTLAAISLRHSPDSITQTALRYGYDTPSGFARAFKKQHQATPTQIARGEREPRLFGSLFFPSPLYSGVDAWRICKGEVKMAQLTHLEFKPFGPYKVIGRAIKTKTLQNDIPMLWGRFFGDGSYQTLLALCEDEANRTTLPDAYAGVMHHFEGNDAFTYLVGLIFPETVAAPEGFDSFSIPAGTIAEAWVQGEEYELYAQSHQLIVSAVETAGRTVNWENFYQCEIYTMERFEEPKQAGLSTITLDYYLPVV